MLMIIASKAGPSLTTNSIMRFIRHKRFLSVGKTTFTIVSSRFLLACGVDAEFMEKDVLFLDEESESELEEDEDDRDDEESV